MSLTNWFFTLIWIVGATVGTYLGTTYFEWNYVWAWTLAGFILSVIIRLVPALGLDLAEAIVD